MGCCTNHFLKGSAEEQLLREQEAYLGFSSFLCIELDLHVRKLCSQSHLSKNQFQVMMEKLNTAAKSPQQSTAALCFFRSILFYQGEYDRTLLLILVVLYGRGSYQDRARVLLDIKDEQVTFEISSTEARSLAHFMIEISLKGVFSLVFEESIEKKAASLMKAYKDSLSKVRGRVEAALSALLVDRHNRCRLEDLLKKVQTPSLGRLLTAVGLRELACEMIQSARQDREPASSPTTVSAPAVLETHS